MITDQEGCCHHHCPGTCSVNSTQLGSCGCGESADLRPRYGPRSPRALAARAASSSAAAVVEVEDMSRVESVDSGGDEMREYSSR